MFVLGIVMRQRLGAPSCARAEWDHVPMGTSSEDRPGSVTKRWRGRVVSFELAGRTRRRT